MNKQNVQWASELIGDDYKQWGNEIIFFRFRHWAR